MSHDLEDHESINTLLARQKEVLDRLEEIRQRVMVLEASHARQEGAVNMGKWILALLLALGTIVLGIVGITKGIGH